MRAAATSISRTRASTNTPASQESGLTRNQIISELTRSPHGDLNQYLPIGQRAATSDPEFLAHLIAWNHDKGQIRDSKVALPTITLNNSTTATLPEFAENALAHLALLDPRNLVRALQFAWEIKTPGHTRALRRLVERYLRTREAVPPWWEKTALAHRASLKTLYGRFHVKPAAYCDLALMKNQPAPGSLLAAVRDLPKLSAADAAHLISERKIPFLVALGALGSRIKEPDLQVALISRMSSTELVTNAALLEKAGVRNQPETRAAFEAKLAEATSSKARPATTFKAGKAASAITDTHLREKVAGLQERQIKALGGVEGNWLVLGDMSGSMQQSIEISKLVASTLAHSVKGQVHLIFFNQEPRYFDVTGKNHEEIIAATKYISAGGGTSIGCGLQYLLDRNIEVDGIAIVSDGGEHGSPLFSSVYLAYSAAFGKEVPIYHYLVSGSDPNTFAAYMAQAHFDVQVLNLLGGVDYYSLPNLILTMRTQRYSLADEIMQVPLLTLDEAFKAQARSTH